MSEVVGDSCNAFAAFVVRLWSDVASDRYMQRSSELMTDLITPKPIIIVIDDDPSILRALRRLVSGAGFEVRTFDRPSTLLKSDLPKAGACLIVDIDLPEMNGVELCATLATSGCTLPVILITAHTDEETRRLADGASPVALLIKPFGRELLVNSIESALLAGRQ
jgi:two-component system, LuxR family, response regulator FixJ